MSSQEDQAVWANILAILEEQLQYGFLEQAKSVVDVHFAGSELMLTVASEEAAEFFSADINQQRLMIVSRPIVRIESIAVKTVEAEPIA